MGKRSKLLKSSLPRTAIPSSLPKPIPKQTPKPKTSTHSDSEDDNDQFPPTKQQYLNHTVNYDVKLLQKHNETLGLDDKDIQSLISRPIRTRRNVEHSVLTKRQKKRLLREQKKDKFTLMEKNTKLNLSYAPHQLPSSHPKQPKPTLNKVEGNFSFKEFGSEMNNIIDEIQKNEEQEHVAISKFRNLKRKKAMLDKEKERIAKIIQKNNFSSNQNESMKLHIKNAQMVEKRNKKLKEEYNKNYNLLNLK